MKSSDFRANEERPREAGTLIRCLDDVASGWSHDGRANENGISENGDREAAEPPLRPVINSLQLKHKLGRSVLSNTFQRVWDRKWKAPARLAFGFSRLSFIIPTGKRIIIKSVWLTAVIWGRARPAPVSAMSRTHMDAVRLMLQLLARHARAHTHPPPPNVIILPFFLQALFKGWINVISQRGLVPTSFRFSPESLKPN